MHNCAVSVPGRALSGVIASLKDELSEETFELLSSFHADVVNMLKSRDGSYEAELQEKLPLLVAAALGQKNEFIKVEKSEVLDQ